MTGPAAPKPHARPAASPAGDRPLRLFPVHVPACLIRDGWWLSPSDRPQPAPTARPPHRAGQKKP